MPRVITLSVVTFAVVIAFAAGLSGGTPSDSSKTIRQGVPVAATVTAVNVNSEATVSAQEQECTKTHCAFYVYEPIPGPTDDYVVQECATLDQIIYRGPDGLLFGDCETCDQGCFNAKAGPGLVGAMGGDTPRPIVPPNFTPKYASHVSIVDSYIIEIIPKDFSADDSLWVRLYVTRTDPRSVGSPGKPIYVGRGREVEKSPAYEPYFTVRSFVADKPYAGTLKMNDMKFRIETHNKMHP